MKTHLITSSLAAITVCSFAQAALVDFTINNGTDPNVFVQNAPTVTGVSLGSGITADITADNPNSGANANFTIRQFRGGLGMQANGNQLNAGQLIVFTFSNIQLNGGSLPQGVSVNFDLNHLLWTNPTVGGYVFDGSNNLPSGLGVGIDGGATSTTDGFLDLTSANGATGSTSSHDLAFSTAQGVSTIELAPTQSYNFNTVFSVRNINPPNIGGNQDTFYVQGFDISANVVPEPSSTALLGLGGLALLLRRRK